MGAVREEPGAGDGAWGAAIALLEEDMRRRDAAERTRRAYGTDLRQFARWADQQGLAPTERRPQGGTPLHSAALRAGSRSSTSARKLAALRALFASQREHGLITQNPADLVSTPRRSAHLPRVLSAREAGRLLDAIPGSGPLEMRDRALFELAYSSGLRAEELVSLSLSDIDHDAEQLRVEGKGRKTRIVPVGEPAMAAVRLYLERARPALLGEARRPGDAGEPAAAGERPPRAAARGRRCFSAGAGGRLAQAT